MTKILRRIATSSYAAWVVVAMIFIPLAVIVIMFEIILENAANTWRDITRVDWELPTSRADYEVARREEKR